MCIEYFEKLPKFFFKGDEYIVWQDDTTCRVGFSEIPDIGNKEINKNVMSKDEIKRAKNKPLYVKNDVTVCLADKCKNKTYVFPIEKGYDYDGASIPRLFWRDIGTKTDPSFLIASLIHDVLCENHHYVDNDRHFSSCVFDALLKVSKVSGFKRYLMKNSVDIYQRFCKW